MTIAQWLVSSMTTIHQAGVPNGRTDCLVLLSDLFKVDKSWVHTHPEHELSADQLTELNFKLHKRAKRVPLAYIRGFSEFYGRYFTVNKRVLIPRPESESFITLLKEVSDSLQAPQIADIGTGSGCLGITAALELTNSSVDLYDIDTAALEVAKHNARTHKVNVNIFQSNLLKDLHPTRYDTLLANLPYVPNKLITSPEIEEEPALALFSGEDGLNHYRAFWHQLESIDATPQYILTESLTSQHTANTNLAAESGYKLIKTDVLVQLFQRDY